jgi:putative membrane protein
MKQLLSSVALVAMLAQPGLVPRLGPWQGAALAQTALSEQDLTFAEEAAKGGLLEVELGELAAQQAKSDDVVQFGQRMVKDHGMTNDQLKSIAAQKGITLPDSLDQDQQHTVEELSQVSGEEFDKAYMDEMVKGHQTDVEAFREQAESGQDPDLRAFAEQTLPTLEEHLSTAQQIDQELAAAPPDDRLDLAVRQ